MIKSMTGFASLTDDDEAATITVTVRSVNHRFLDLQLRMPPTLAAVESRRRAPALEVELNEPFLQALGAALARAREQGYIDGVMTPGDLLRFPQALSIKDRPEAEGASEEQLARTAARVQQAVAAALRDLDEMRTREGGFLRAELDARRGQLGELFDQVAASADQALEALRVRLGERVKELRADGLADEATVAQEIARFVGRSDITEEVVRFRGHLEHWRALSDSPEPCGRKLDFLLQEMNREVNTVGSKAEGTGVTELVVALKAELEKMREQVQNVE